MLSIQLCVKYHDIDISKPNKVPKIEAKEVSPNNGNLISFFKKCPYLGLNTCNIVSSIRIEEQPMQDISIIIVNTPLTVSKKRYNTNSIALEEKKKIIADESFKSVYSYSSTDISLMIYRGGVLITVTIIITAIPNSTKKLTSKLLSLF